MSDDKEDKVGVHVIDLKAPDAEEQLAEIVRKAKGDGMPEEARDRLQQSVKRLIEMGKNVGKAQGHALNEDGTCRSCGITHEAYGSEIEAQHAVMTYLGTEQPKVGDLVELNEFGEKSFSLVRGAHRNNRGAVIVVEIYPEYRKGGNNEYYNALVVASDAKGEMLYEVMDLRKLRKVQQSQVMN